MKQKTGAIIIGLVVLIVAGFAAYSTSTVTKPTIKNSAPAAAAPAASYTLADVQKHKTATDCWTAVDGKVYDVSSWIGQHPGGAQAIIGMCGIDASAAFNGQHGGERRPTSELNSFIIGTLK